MPLRKTSRRFVACATVALFLACQGMAIAHTSLPDLPPSGSGTAQEPCHHDMGEQGGKTDGGKCHAPCQYQNASSTPHTSVHAITDLPAIAIAFAPEPAAARATAPATVARARIEPPPFSILYCRLRN